MTLLPRLGENAHQIASGIGLLVLRLAVGVGFAVVMAARRASVLRS